MNIAHLSRLCKCTTIALTVAASPHVAADGFGPSAMVQGSLTAAGGSVIMVAGTPSMLVGEPSWTILGVETVAEGMRLTLRGTAQTASVIIIVPVATAAAASVVVGKTLEVMGKAGSQILTCGGNVIGVVTQDGLLFSERDCCGGR